jgi:hypothetical protein
VVPDELGPDHSEHPRDSVDFVADHVRLRKRYAERLRRRGVPNAEVAAAVSAARGRCGETVDQFARRLRVDVYEIEVAEAGQFTWEQLPPAMAFAIRRN